MMLPHNEDAGQEASKERDDRGNHRLGRTETNSVVYAGDRDDQVEGIRPPGMGSGAID